MHDRRFVFFASIVACAHVTVSRCEALSVDELPAGHAWRVGAISIEGNRAIADGALQEKMLTKERPWYKPWAARPAFDPVTFTTDLDRLRRTYESRGYYAAQIDYDLEADAEKDLVRIQLRVVEGEPVRVGSVVVDLDSSASQSPSATPPPTAVPLAAGEVFEEERYQLAETRLRDFYLDHGYAHVATERHARVDLDRDLAEVRYAARPGPVAMFGQTTVTGTQAVDPEIVLRELTYEPGDRFSREKLAESRAAILKLNLFSSVRMTTHLDASDPRVVPIEISVTEKPWHLLRIGIGYGTDDGFRGQIDWSSFNWLGDGRQLSIRLKGSQINREASAGFIQPHLFGARNRGSIDFRLFQEDEESYLRSATQLIPRFQRNFSRTVTAFVGYRIEYDHLSDVDRATRTEIGGVISKGILSAPLVGIVWNTADDPLNPKRGHVLSFQALQGGGIWGGPFHYWRIDSEARQYVSVGWRVVLAGRIALGLADSIGSIEHLPIFERLYAGGEHSVRGYGRRRLGPLSDSNDPLGGRSLLEGSAEVRRPIWGALGGAVFLDFGNVALKALSPPIAHLKFAPGVGLTYDTPIGPLRLDVGFPLDPPPGDPAWQLHFSIGQFF